MAFTLKQNDTSPSIQATLKDASGSAVDLSGATVKFHVKSVDGTLKVNQTATLVDEDNGVVKYDWQAGDTDTVGTYYAEFQVSYADLTTETFPNNDNIVILIKSELN
jgi:hypothetical protein